MDANKRKEKNQRDAQHNANAVLEWATFENADPIADLVNFVDVIFHLQPHARIDSRAEASRERPYMSHNNNSKGGML